MKPLVLLALTTGLAFSQGPLSPPGLPEPTMKTLDQIEARTAIPASPAVPIAGPHFTIAQSGSYYLTGNVEVASGNGIEINASNVTLDLNGFALVSTTASPSSGHAINLAGGISGIEIKNGRITGGTVRTYTGPRSWNATFANSGWYGGIGQASGPSATCVLLSHLTVEKCSVGVSLSGKGACLDHITATSNSAGGIHASESSITNTTATSNGADGINATFGSVTNCNATDNGLSGINADRGCIINSIATNNGTVGIFVAGGSITNATASYNGASGIQAYNSSVTNASASFNGSRGIFVDQGSIANAIVTDNGANGIQAYNGSVTNATATNNGADGIDAPDGSVTNCRASYNFHVGINVDAGVAAHCVASNNSSDPATVNKEIAVTPGFGQRDACVPAAE